MNQSSKKPSETLTRWGPLLIVAVCLGLYFFFTRPTGALAGWSTDFDAAQTLARQQNKGMVVAFHSQNCPPCYAMERTVLHEGPIVTALKNLVAVRVDPFERADLGARFNVLGTPTYLLLSPAGDVLGRRMGYVPTNEFVTFLSQATAAAAPSVEAAESPPADP